MENQNPKFIEITDRSVKSNTTETPVQEKSETNGNNNVADDALIRAIAEAGMGLLKQLAKDKVAKVITDFQEKGSINSKEGKQVLEQLQREAELARLRNEQQNAAQQSPSVESVKKLKKRVRRLEDEVKELKTMLLLLNGMNKG